MKRRAAIIALLTIFLFTETLPLAWSKESIFLRPILEEALKNNPEITAARRRWEASLARIPQAKSLDDPKFEINFMKMSGGPFKFDKAMPEDRMLSVTQMFPFFGKLSLKGKIALMESQVAASEYKSKELEVINEVKNAYYELFMNYREIELSQKSLEFLNNIARIAEAQYALGDMPQEYVFKVYSELASLSNKVANLKQELSARSTRLNSLLNREPEQPLGVPDLQEDLSFNQDITTLYRLTIESQPELLIFSYAIEKNKYAKALAKKSLLPDVMLGTALRGIVSGGGVGPWDLMMAFSLPLWFWTKQRYEIKEAIANLDEAQAVYEAMKNRALSQTKTLFTKVKIAEDKILLYRTSLIPILKSSIESSLAAVRSGKGDFMMLLDSERMLLDTQMGYYNALVDYNINLADLEWAVGGFLNEVEK